MIKHRMQEKLSKLVINHQPLSENQPSIKASTSSKTPSSYNFGQFQFSDLLDQDDHPGSKLVSASERAFQQPLTDVHLLPMDAVLWRSNVLPEHLRPSEANRERRCEHLSKGNSCGNCEPHRISFLRGNREAYWPLQDADLPNIYLAVHPHF